MTTPKHATIAEHTPQDDGSIIIDTKSYLEKFSSHKIEHQFRHKSNTTHLPADIIKLLAVIMSNQTTEMTISMRKHGYGEYIITQTYTVSKEDFNKR